MSNFYWDDINVKVDDSCPIATSDISVNLKNRQKAIDTAGYGPLNPTKPNNEFWDAKAERWNVTADDARDQKCGNCAAFIQTKRILDCIDKGLGNESGNSAWDVINAGDLGYCEAFDFKCASSRTCDAWIVGGPITEEKENNMEEKSLEDMYSELLAIEEKSLEDTYLELLAIEEKAGLIVPVRPDPKPFRPTLERRRGQRPPLPGPGPGGMGMGRYKAEEEDEPEDDMLYDEDYMGDEEDDKAMMRPGGAGSPRDASDRQRGQQFMNWASGRSPSGDNVHPTSVGNIDIGDSGRRNVANSRMTDLMRNRSWTNPRPRPGVGSRATAINTGPPARPKNIAPAPLPTQGYSPKKKKPRDWGSDNNAQLISGATSGFDNTSKSAWDEEAYYEYDYDFNMKKLPIQGASPKPYKASGPSADARAGASVAKDRAGLAAAGRYFGDPQKGKERIRSFGNTAIGAAGPASGAPIGDNRGTSKRYAARVGKNPGSPTAAAERQKRSTTYGPTGGAQPRPTRGPGNPGAPKPRPTRGSGNPGPKVNQQRSLATAGDYFSGRSGDPRANAQQQAARGRGRVSKFGRDVIGDGSSLPGADRKGPQPKPGKLNSVNPRIDRSDPPRQRPLALFQAVPSQKKPSQGFGKFGKPKTFSGSPGAGGPRERINPNIRSFSGKSYDQGYDEYDEYEDYLYQKSYDQGYDDEDDEMAIPPDTDDKAANPGSYEQSAGRERFRQFGDHLNAMDVAKGPQRDAESAKRKAGLSKYVAGYSSAMGTAQTYGGNRSTSKPRPIRGPGARPNTPVGGGRGLNPGNPGPNKRPNTTMPNRPGNQAPGGTPPTMVGNRGGNGRAIGGSSGNGNMVGNRGGNGIGATGSSGNGNMVGNPGARNGIGTPGKYSLTDGIGRTNGNGGMIGNRGNSNGIGNRRT